MSNLGPKHVKDLFEGLLGRDVEIADCPPARLDANPRPTLATYVDDTGALAAVAVMDFALTAYTGAALGLVPKGGAEIAIEEKAIPVSLFENAAEMLNVLAAPIGESSGKHQRLAETYGPDQLPPSHVSQWAATLGSRTDFALDIKGYGTGTLSVVATTS